MAHVPYLCTGTGDIVLFRSTRFTQPKGAVGATSMHSQAVDYMCRSSTAMKSSRVIASGFAIQTGKLVFKSTSLNSAWKTRGAGDDDRTMNSKEQTRVRAAVEKTFSKKL